ncbi:unnamed protein product [Cyclocybe aegerita]|uniref:Dihydroorotate dehydrogenase (quinone), mitochondrial n=1 Tax=Cyclocybe aegerita TaxID=1973307 RepID=A0A8S0XSV7_CYCAE|nr:unnamed protein product [Cyclocybe aegerita]
MTTAKIHPTTLRDSVLDLFSLRHSISSTRSRMPILQHGISHRLARSSLNLSKHARSSRRTLFTKSTSAPRSPAQTGLYTTAFVLSAGLFTVYYLDARSALHRYIITPIVRNVFDAETGHKLAVKTLKAGFAPKDPLLDDKLLGCRMWGEQISNPIGLAAGFDKDGEAIDGLFGLGFSWVEIGSVTPNPQPGNPRPRVFRLEEDGAVINRYGFPSQGHSSVLARVRARIPTFFTGPDRAAFRPGAMLAVNLGKNKESPVDSIDDFVAGVRTFGPYSDVLVVNVSSPNTPGLRGLQNRDVLERLLDGVTKARDQLEPSPITARKPKVVLKIAPDLEESQLVEMAAVIRKSKVDGVIVSNTTIQRPKTLQNPNKTEVGGLSGPPVKPFALKALKTLRKELPASIPLIGCGGITTGKDALDYAKAGASMVQVYTSFGYDGVGACRRIKDQLVEELKREGKSWEQVVDAAVAQLSWKEPTPEQKKEQAIKQLVSEAEELRAMLDQLADQGPFPFNRLMDSPRSVRPRSIRSSSSSSSLASTASVTATHLPGNSTSISSRLSLRHGISSDHLKLLAANPPETKFANLSCHPKDDQGRAALIDAETGVEVQRHADLWFDDGSVICRAEDTLFCVHMSQLARHSLVFHDMFMLPQPEASRLESSMLVHEGKSRRIPVVYLYDTAEDVGNLLTALYDGPSFGNNDEDDFRVVSGILRLSTKYLVDSLRAKAIAHLSIAWPADLKAWDAREDLVRSYDSEGGSSSRGVSRYPHPFEVISLAREVNAPSLLPSAFYDLSRHSFTQIYEPNEDDSLYRPYTPPPLSAADIQRLALGKEASQHTITTLIQSMGSGQYIRSNQQHTTNSHFRKTSSGGICVSAAACRKDFTELVDLATQHYLFDRERGCYDPLYVAEELGQLKSAEFSECKACAKSLESWAAREREKMWKMIPLWFRLETGSGRDASSPIPN